MRDFQKKLSNSFYAVVSLPATAMGFALSIQIAALSWIMSFRYNLNIEEVGIVWAAGPLAGIFGQVIVGMISDNVWFWGGRRRPFILIGGTLAALMLLALPNLDAIKSFFGFGDILVVAVMVALTLDMSINISFNPTRSVIADVTPEGIPRTKGYTWMQTISGFFGVLAYFVGIVFDNFFLIYFGAVLVFLFSVVPLIFISEPKSLKLEEKDDQPYKKSSVWDIIKVIEPLWGYVPFATYFLIINAFEIRVDEAFNDYLIIAFIILHGLLTLKTFFKKPAHNNIEQTSRIGFQKVLSAHSFSWIGVQTMFVYMFAFIREFKYGSDSELLPEQQNEIGVIINVSFLILNAVGFILPAFVLEPFTEKIGRIKTHFISIGIMSAGYWSIALFTNSPVMLYIFMAVCGIGWAAVVSLPFAIMSEKVDKSLMGLYMGIFNLSVVLPQLIVSSGIGRIIQNSEGKNIIFIISGVSLMISAVLWSLIREDRNSRSED
ncbi:MAG: MFS transporter [Melioribacteraceae bacterium]|nr:MFS transporter [Melioribacteraceae bacterium]